MASNTNEYQNGEMQTMKYIDEYIEFFYEKFGPSIYEKSVPEEFIEKYKEKLPETLINYWKEYGWCGYGEGILWTVNPEEYKEVVEEWLKDTPFESLDRYHLIAIGAFGEMILWGEETGNSLSITARSGMIFPKDKTKFIKGKSDGLDFLIRALFSGLKKSYMDVKDDNREFMFEKVKALLGTLKPGEMYGFSPSLMMGGEANIYSVKKVNAAGHLLFLASLGEKMIMEDIAKMLEDD